MGVRIKRKSLREWIDEVGVQNIAKLLKVDRSAVAHWRRGFCLPSSRQMAAIIKFSNGTVNLEREISAFHKTG